MNTLTLQEVMKAYNMPSGSIKRVEKISSEGWPYYGGKVTLHYLDGTSEQVEFTPELDEKYSLSKNSQNIEPGNNWVFKYYNL